MSIWKYRLAVVFAAGIPSALQGEAAVSEIFREIRQETAAEGELEEKNRTDSGDLPETSIPECLEEKYTYLANSPDVYNAYPEHIMHQEVSYCLETVSYEVLPLTAMLFIVSNDLWEEMEYTAEPILEQDGITYILQNVKKEEWLETGRTRFVSASRTFLEGEEIPDMLRTGTKDPVTGAVVEAEVPKTDQQEDGAGWKEGDLEIPVTYMNYQNGTGEYEINGEMVRLTDNTPAFDQFREKILVQNRLDPLSNRITTITWEGEAYTDSQGVWCRKAIAVGDRLIPRYRAVYQGDVPLPDLPMVRYTACYQSEASEWLITARLSYLPQEQEENLTGQLAQFRDEAEGADCDRITETVMIILEVLTGIMLSAVLLTIFRAGK